MNLVFYMMSHIWLLSLGCEIMLYLHLLASRLLGVLPKGESEVTGSCRVNHLSTLFRAYLTHHDVTSAGIPSWYSRPQHRVLPSTAVRVTVLSHDVTMTLLASAASRTSLNRQWETN